MIGNHRRDLAINQLLAADAVFLFSTEVIDLIASYGGGDHYDEYQHFVTERTMTYGIQRTYKYQFNDTLMQITADIHSNFVETSGWLVILKEPGILGVHMAFGDGASISNPPNFDSSYTDPTGQYASQSTVPIPSTISLLGLGLLGVAGGNRKKK